MQDSQILDDECNPIDGLETILHGYNWVFDRLNDEEIHLKLSGSMNEYNLYFIWDEATNMLQICCQYDVDIPAVHHDALKDLIADINENLYLGHFYLPKNASKPSFRYNAYMKGLSQSQADATANEILEMCLSQCERCSSAITVLTQSQSANSDMLSLALMEAQGQS